MSEISVIEDESGAKSLSTLTPEEKDLIFETLGGEQKLPYQTQIDMRWLADYNQLLWTEDIENEEIAMRAAIAMDAELNGSNCRVVPRVKFTIKGDFITMFSADTLARYESGKFILLMVPAGVSVSAGVVYIGVSDHNNAAAVPCHGYPAQEIVAHCPAFLEWLVANGARYTRQEEYWAREGRVTRSPLIVSGAEIKESTEFPRGRKETFISLVESLRGDYWGRLTSWAVMQLLKAPVKNAAKAVAVDMPRVEDPKIMELEKIAGVPFGEGRARIADLYFAGLLRVLYGESKETIERVKVANASRKFAEKNAKSRAAAERLLGEYKNIISEKLGAAKLGRILMDLAINPKGGILARLTTGERKIVELEKSLRDKYLSALVANKCAHIQALRAMIAAPSAQALASVEVFVGVVAATTIIKCKVCKFDLICPHLLTKWRLEMTRAPQSAMRAAIDKYSSVRADNGNIYCNICGEVLFVDITEYTDKIGEAVAMADEELTEMIWSEALVIIRYVKFPAVIVLTKLVASLRNSIYTPVYDMARQIEKSKTTLAEEMHSKKKLYTAIYICAWIIKFANENKTLGITFKDFTAPPGKEIPAMIKKGVEVLMTSHNLTLKTVRGVDAEFIKNALVSAYKALSTDDASAVIASVSVEASRAGIINDPIVDMIYRIDCMSRGGIPKDTTLGERVIERVLGGYKFETKAPVSKKAAKAEAKSATVVFAHVPRVKLRGERAAILTESLADILRNITDGLHLKPGYVNVAAKKDGAVETKMTDYYAKSLASLETILAKERKLNIARARHFMRPYTIPIPPDGDYPHAPGESRRRIWSRVEVPVGALYDEDGRAHVWGIVVLKGSPNTERKIADINGAVGEIFDKTTIVDYKCSVCGKTRTEAWNDLDSEKVRMAVDRREMFTNLFKFFSFRCPLAEIHRMEGTPGVCAQCGYAASMAKGGPEANAYFDKWKSYYVKNKSAAAPATPPEPAAPIHVELEDWSFNFDIILELASMIGINHRVLAALGGFERADFHDVESGKFIAPDPEEKHSMRIVRAVGYAQQLIVEYNQLRNLYRMHNPPKAVIAMVEGAGIARSRLEEISAAMPEIDVTFMDRIYRFWQEKKPRDTFNFALQRIAERLIILIKTKAPQDITGLFTTFAKTFIGGIIKGEALLTKPGYFNWNLIYGAKTDKETSEFDADAVESETVDAAPDEESPVGDDAFDVEAPEEGDDDTPQDLIRVSGIDN